MTFQYHQLSGFVANMMLHDVISRLQNGGSVGTPSSWRSSDDVCSPTPDDSSSLSPPGSSCDTPHPPDDSGELTYTIGVTEHTPYACQFCDKAFPRQSYLKRHEQIHSDHMPFRCDYCQRLFKHKRSRDRHVKLHTGDKKYRCDQCEAAFSRSDHLKIHMKTHDHAKPYQCALCNRGYNTAAALTSHMQNHRKSAAEASRAALKASSLSPITSDSKLQNGGRHRNTSPIVAAAQSTEEDAIKTKKLRSESTKSSESVSSVSPTMVAGQVAFPNVTPPSISQPVASPLLCSICNRSDFGTLENLHLHIQAVHMPFSPMVASLVNSAKAAFHHPAAFDFTRLRHSPPAAATAETFNCQYCQMKLPSVHALQTHTLAMHSYNEILNQIIKARANAAEIKLRCPQCGVETQGSLELAEHIRQVHKFTLNGTLTGGPLFCSQCGAASPDFETFRAHLASHLEPTRVSRSCPECRAEFGSSQQLETHVASHYLATATEYSCPPCGKAFQRPEDLQKHMMETHVNHIYRCAICRDSFDSKGDAQMHFAVKHNSETRMFKCSACNAVYRSEPEFALHVQVNHLSKASPYRCLLCDQSFPSEPLLQRHVDTHGKQFPCSMCDEAFHVEFLLERHIETCHSPQRAQDNDQAENLIVGSKTSPKKHELKNGSTVNSLKCDICDHLFGNEATLSHHRRHAHGLRNNIPMLNGSPAVPVTDGRRHRYQEGVPASAKHKCNICDEMFPSIKTLAEHKLTHCKVIVSHSCAVCRETLKSEEQFMTHTTSHGSGLPLPCIICRQTLTSELEMQMHARFHISSAASSNTDDGAVPAISNEHRCAKCGQSENDLSERFLCKTCESVSSQTHQQRNQLKRGVSSVRCSQCNVKFESSAELEQHERIDHHPKPWPSSDAHHTEATSSQSKRPKKTLNGPNVCHLCGNASFQEMVDLQAHLIEHNFEGCRGYSCYLCGAMFTAAKPLHTHMVEHGLDQRPFDCNRCSEKYFFRAELENHEMGVHTAAQPNKNDPNLTTTDQQVPVENSHVAADTSGDNNTKEEHPDDDEDEEVSVDS